MQRIMTTCIAAMLLVAGCQQAVPASKATRPAIAGAPAGELPVSPQVYPKRETLRAQPLSVDEAKTQAKALLAQKFGNPGTFERSIASSAQDLARRSDLYTGLAASGLSLILVEHRGAFRPVVGKGGQGEVHPFAAVVFDAQTGEMISESTYVEKFRPR